MIDQVRDPDTWIIIKDADAMVLTPFPEFNHVVSDVIAQYPNIPLFSCMTNRVGNYLQCHGGEISENFDMIHHRTIAEQRLAKYGSKVKPVKTPLSGISFLFQKHTWEAVGGFSEGPQSSGDQTYVKSGMYGIDNNFCHRVMKHTGQSLGIMLGTYMLHYYRSKEGAKHTKHLK